MCGDELNNGEQRRALKRIVNETTSACNATANCTETPGTFCPEGTMCDCQRQWTPERGAKAFTMTFWAISPATVMLISGTAAFMTGGLAAIPGAVWTAGWFPDYIPAMFAMAAFSRKWTPECMCFQMECKFDVGKGMCMMSPVEGMSGTSSNPYAALPSNGVKCAIRVGETQTTCEQQVCEKADIAQRSGNLFGRVGHEGKNLYNCANTKGTKASLLGFLDQLSDGSGVTVPNTPAARVDLYNRYPDLSVQSFEPKTKQRLEVQDLQAPYAMVESGTEGPGSSQIRELTREILPPKGQFSSVSHAPDGA